MPELSVYSESCNFVSIEMDNGADIYVTDQMGRRVCIPAHPKRIVSLVPSQTELLVALDREDALVGITRFCVHPQEIFRKKTRIGGTKQLDFDKIAALNPDLIIGNKEENEESQIRKLMDLYPVWMSDIHDLPEAADMIVRLGAIVGKEERAELIVREIETAFASLSSLVAGKQSKKVAYVIWNNPIMLAGKHTFIDAMLQRCGFENVAASSLDGRYPVCTEEQLKRLSPDLILLSSEPFPFSEKHLDYFQRIVSAARPVLVDGEFYSWYGSRLMQAPRYFAELVKNCL